MSIAGLGRVVSELSLILSCLDAEALSVSEAAEAVSVFVLGENLCAAGKAMCAGRAARGGEHRRCGHSDPASWLAERAGDTRAHARDSLEIAGALGRLAGLGAAVRAGELSPTKARVVAEAALVDGSFEQRLLEVARNGSLSELKDEAEAVKAAARSREDEEKRYEAIRRGRHLRTFTGRDGAFMGQLSLTPDAGAKVMAVLQPASDFFFEEARLQAGREHNDAYLADALVAVITGKWQAAGTEDDDVEDDEAGHREAEHREAEHSAGAGHSSGAEHSAVAGHSLGASLPGPENPDEPAGTPPAGNGPARPVRRRRRGRAEPPPATVICRVDLAALRRGALVPGESCEIPGVGPVPVSVAQELFGDCFLKLVVSDGIDVRTILHYGRTIPTHLKTALQFRDRCCVVPGCGRTFGLEYDHIVEFAKGGPTTLDNLCRLCGPHHALKTHKGYRIRGAPGRWEWVAPARRQASAGEVAATGAPAR